MASASRESLHYKMNIEENNLNVNVLEYKPLKKTEGITVVVHLLPGSRKPVKQKYKFRMFDKPFVFEKLTRDEKRGLTVVIRVKKKNWRKEIQFNGEVQVPLKALPIDEWEDLHELSSQEGGEPELHPISNKMMKLSLTKGVTGEKAASADQNISNLLDEPWRKVNEKDPWTEEVLQSLKKKILTHEHIKAAKVEMFNILLLGQIGSGKSSFCNTVHSVFGTRVISKATVGGGGAGGGSESVTTHYRKYKIGTSKDEDEYLKFTFCDSMGLEVEKDKGLNAEYVANIMDGRIEDMTELSNKGVFNPSPTESDKIHCVAFVMNLAQVDFDDPTITDKLNLITKEANRRFLKTIIILTHVDKVCMEVDKDITKVYRSKIIKEKVDDVCRKFDVNDSMVYPVRNYTEQRVKVAGIDILNLRTLHQILELSEDFLDDKKDRDKTNRSQNKKRYLAGRDTSSEDDESDNTKVLFPKHDGTSHAC